MLNVIDVLDVLDVKLLEVFKWMWLMLDVYIWVIKKIVWGVGMNGVKIKSIQKKSSNLLEAFGESCLKIL